MDLLATESPGRLHQLLLTQDVWVLWGLCVVSIAALVFGADRTGTSAVRLARRLGMSTVIIGADIVNLLSVSGLCLRATGRRAPQSENELPGGGRS